MKEKYKTCIHAKEIGSMAVYVHPTCKRATMIKGVLVSSKDRCRKCESYEERPADWKSRMLDKFLKGH